MYKDWANTPVEFFAVLVDSIYCEDIIEYDV